MYEADEILELYNRKDSEMRSRLSVPEVQAFSPGTFDQIGWPHSVARAPDLVRYADWCNHPGANDYFGSRPYLPTQCASLLFTPAEAALLRKISAAVGDFTRALGHEVRPALNHVAQIGPFIIMMEKKKRLGLDRLTVFDVGAGSGYQSALLSLAGNRTLLTDNTQGLYLFQSMLMKACRKGDVRDWLTDGPPLGPLDAGVHMVPWWEYLALRHGTLSDVDIFFSNNNLGEMNYGAAAFTCYLAKQLMASSRAKMFFFTCLGSPKQSSIEMIDQLLQRAGFVNVVWQPFWLYIPKGHSLPKDLFDFAGDIPVWGAESGGPLLSVRDVIDADPKTLPPELDFVSFTGVFNINKHLVGNPEPSPADEPRELVRAPEEHPHNRLGNSRLARRVARAWRYIERR